MTLSPGSSSAMYAAMFALAPECGCTLAWSAPNSAQAVARELLGVVDDVVAAVVPLPRYPSEYLLVSTEPCAASTAGDVKFSTR